MTTPVQTQLPSYAYSQYSDDPNIDAFFTAYNQISQKNLDNMNSLNLPIYLKQGGDLLNWCGQGIYGVVRHDLSAAVTIDYVGPLNTAELNTDQLNEFQALQVGKANYAVSDYAYQQIIQWNTLPGDGRNFSIGWLKRRIQRFLSGNIFPDQHFAISIKFTAKYAVEITIFPTTRTLIGGAGNDEAEFGQPALGLNQPVFDNRKFVPDDLLQIFKAAVESGALQMPFQYAWTVIIN